MPPPEVMASAPELRADLAVYWEAFERLSTCRGYAGMAGVPTPIPWTAVERYATRHRFAGEAFDDLVTIVSHMDEAFRAHVIEELGNGDAGGVQPPDGEAGG